MKIAYIMLCHKNPEQINRFINSLQHQDNDFYIHIDVKSSIENKLISSDNIFILNKSDRIDVKWGGSSMIHATLRLIKEVLDSGRYYDYIWLISGQDYPIKDNKTISKFLKKNKDANFLHIIEDKKTIGRFLKRVEIYYPKWMVQNNFWSKTTKRTYSVLLRNDRIYKMFKRKNILNYEFYFGSQWWVLTYEAIDYVYELLEGNSAVLDFFENALVPDEMFFQTILMNSRFRNTIKNNLTYIKWEGQAHPKTFTLEDINELESKNFLLARKFDYDIDRDIFDKLDSLILSNIGSSSIISK